MNDKSLALQPRPGPWLKLLAEELRDYFDRELTRLGLTVADWGVLLAVHYAESTTVADLAVCLAADPQWVLERVDGLLGAGLLVCNPLDSDSAAFEVQLSPAGRALLPTLIGIADRANGMIFQGLTDDQRNQLDICLRQVMEAAELPAGHAVPGGKAGGAPITT